MTIWEYQRLIIRRLIQLSLLSGGIGALMLPGSRFWREFGKQFIAFSVIEMGIAWLGVRITGERHAALPDPVAPDAVKRETQDLRRLLEASVYVDLATMFIGRFAIRRGSGGGGWGVLLQGAFLFLFDLFHAGNVPSDKPNLPRPRRRRKAFASRSTAKSGGL